MKAKGNQQTDWTRGSKAAVSHFLTLYFSFFDIRCPVLRIMKQSRKA